MNKLKTNFKSREELLSYVRQLSPTARGDSTDNFLTVPDVNDFISNFDPVLYAETRNFGQGKTTRLSPFISHGMLDIETIRKKITEQYEPEQCLRFVQELAWRHFWRDMAVRNPEHIWTSAEPYKTGWVESDYCRELPVDIASGSTGVAVIDHFIREVIEAGYVHNHARMYIASYVVHFRKVSWQAGARWFLEHLLDAEEASNNFSWQWVASTFSNKPYIFNLDNITHFFPELSCLSIENNQEIHDSYENLNKRLFPNKAE